jgi:hypothetical protein
VSGLKVYNNKKSENIAKHLTNKGSRENKQTVKLGKFPKFKSFILLGPVLAKIFFKLKFIIYFAGTGPTRLKNKKS